jgi:putative PIN family toxin of toxin-antitoxin system
MADDLDQRPRVVLDTNVLLQAIATKGPFRPIIEAFEKSVFVLILSNAILLEYEHILKRQGSDRAWPAFQALLAALPNNSILVSPSYHWQAIRRDPDDDKFVDAAVAGDAEWIVTEDSHFDDLVPDTRLVVRPLDPRKFIEILSGPFHNYL